MLKELKLMLDGSRTVQPIVGGSDLEVDHV